MEHYATKKDGKTLIHVYNPAPGINTEQRFRVIAPSGKEIISPSKSGGTQSLTWEFYIEDYPHDFIEPYPNQSTGCRFTVYVQKDVYYLFGWTGWKDDSSATITYSIYENDTTRPKIDTFRVTSHGTENGYNMTGKTYVSAQITGIPKLGASITKREFVVEGVTYDEATSFTSAPFIGSGNIVVKGIVTDSRGFKNTATHTIQVLARMPSLNEVTSSTGNLDDMITYNFTPPNAVFCSRLLIDSKVGDTYTTEATINIGAISNNQATNKTYTLLANELKSIYEKYPSTTDVPLRFTLQTYKDSSYKDKMPEEYSKSLTLKIPQNNDTKPSIDSIEIVPSLIVLNNDKLFVKTKNGAKTTVISSGKYNATLASVKWEVEQATYDNRASSKNFVTYGDNIPIKVMVVDSRGFTQEKTETIKVYSYDPPKVQVDICQRANDIGEANDEGERLHVKASRIYSTIGGNNKCDLFWRLKEANDSWTDFKNLLYPDDKEDTADTYFPEIWSDMVYRFELKVQDSFGAESTYLATIPSANVYMDRNGYLNSIAFGGYASIPDALECKWQAIFYQGVSVDNGEAGIVLKSTSGNRVFRITVDDNGTLKATEVNQAFSLRKE